MPLYKTEENSHYKYKYNFIFFQRVGRFAWSGRCGDIQRARVRCRLDANLGQEPFRLLVLARGVRRLAVRRRLLRRSSGGSLQTAEEKLAESTLIFTGIPSTQQILIGIENNRA